jgi:hypothetical protein
MSGKHKTVFCNVRPLPAVGAAHALDAHFLDKVAIFPHRDVVMPRNQIV